MTTPTSQAQRITQALLAKYTICEWSDDGVESYLMSPNELAAVLLPLLAPEQTDNELGRLYNEVYAMVDFLEGYLDGMVCDAGNPDGGSVESCEHCQLSKWKERLEQIETSSPALKVAPVADSTPNPAPVWKREIPTTNGWYWFKWKSDGEPAIYRLIADRLINSEGVGLPLSKLDGYFSGPLVAPAMDGGEK